MGLFFVAIVDASAHYEVTKPAPPARDQREDTTMTTYSEPHNTEGTWRTIETGDDGIAVSIALASRDDRTAGESFPYDSNCTRCYLGSAHSGALHRSNLRLADARAKR